MQILPVMKPKLAPLSLVEPYLAKMYERGTFSNRGPLIHEFEQKLSQLLGVDATQVVTCANATLAIQGAAKILPINRFVVPSFTFPATVHSLTATGKKVELIDVFEDTWESDPTDSVGEFALVRVSPFGAIPHYEDAANYPFLILDAAASIGSAKFELSDLPLNAVIIFSFHATKVLGIGEGAVAVFGNSDFAELFRRWINFGFSGTRNSEILGTNAKLSEIGASFGLAALEHWDCEKSEWSRIRSHAERISMLWEIDPRLKLGTGINPYWIVSFSSESQALQINDRLQQSGIEVRKWWGEGCHRMKAFTHLNTRAFPKTEKICARYLGLPFFRGITAEDFSRVESSIEYVINHDA